MKDVDNNNYPVYKTKTEVFEAAHFNESFFDSFADSLKNSWKFYIKTSSI